MKILFTGSTGMIGREVLKRIESLSSPKDKIYLLKHRRDISLEMPGNLCIISNLNDGEKYDLAFHLAANIHTKYGADPDYKAKFFEDNVELTERVCNVAGRVIFTSTDNVFSGGDGRAYKESDIPVPSNNYYSQTKFLAENIILEKKGAVIRLQSMLGVSNNLIIDKVYDALDGKDYWPFWNDIF